eukprot:2365089-Rhodomonas_salina.2
MALDQPDDVLCRTVHRRQQRALDLVDSAPSPQQSHPLLGVAHRLLHQQHRLPPLPIPRRQPSSPRIPPLAPPPRLFSPTSTMLTHGPCPARPSRPRSSSWAAGAAARPALAREAGKEVVVAALVLDLLARVDEGEAEAARGGALLLADGPDLGLARVGGGPVDGRDVPKPLGDRGRRMQHDAPLRVEPVAVPDDDLPQLHGEVGERFGELLRLQLLERRDLELGAVVVRAHEADAQPFVAVQHVLVHDDVAPLAVHPHLVHRCLFPDLRQKPLQVRGCPERRLILHLEVCAQTTLLEELAEFHQLLEL